MRTRTHRVAAALVATSVAAFASPSTADSVVVSIDEPTFLQRVQAAPPTRALDVRARAARAAIGATAVLPNPTLSYEREAIPSLDAHDDFVRLGWSLDLAGRRGLAAASARAAADAERASSQHAAFALHVEARLAFLDALYARAQLARLDDARTALAAIVETLRARATQGDASSYDFDRAALELDLLDDERTSARRELAIAQLRLGAFAGEPRTAYDAAGTLALPNPVAGALTPVRADVDAARAREREAGRDLAAARRSWVPRLELLVGMKATTVGAEDGVGYVVGIGGELPVFDAGGARADKARAEAKRWRSEAQALTVAAAAEAEQARHELALRIEQATAFAAGPAKRVADLQKRVAVAYREGDRSILELLDVHRAARDAGRRVLELVYDARRAELALARALGRKP